MAKSDILFSDIDLSFGLNPSTNDIPRKINENAVKESLKNLILTNYYETPFNSSMGSPIRNLMFEQATPMITIMVKKAIEQIIFSYEPRVELENVSVSLFDDTQTINFEKSLKIDIHYYIVGSRVLKNFDLIIKRTR